MASESDIQSFMERLRSSRNRDLSMFLPLFLAFSGSHPNPSHTQPNSERLVLVNPVTQGMVVIEGTGLDTLLRGVRGKDGHPPASKSAIEALPRVEIGEEEECMICLEECGPGSLVKEMPCKHRFHGECIEKWLGLHGSCPVCRFKMPVEYEEVEKKGDEDREIWVSFSVGRSWRTTHTEEEQNDTSGNEDE